MTLSIRNAQAHELHDIARLDETQHLPFTEYQHALGDAQNTLIVASDVDVVIGFAWLRMLVDEAHVMNIVVESRARRAGVGEKLMRALVAEAIQRKAILITLEVRASNAAAIALYHKFLLAEVGRRKRYYKDGEDALIMTRELG
jgi:ribosomal-protein-alanine N-acetyltransferase